MGAFFWSTSPTPHRQPPGRLFCRSLADPSESGWSAAIDYANYGPPLFLAGSDRFTLFEYRGPPSCVSLSVTRDTRTGQVLSEAGANRDILGRLLLSPDRGLVACRRGTSLAVARADDLGADPVKIRNDSRKEFTGLAFHPSGRFLAATSNDATVKLYDTSTWTLAQAFNWDIGRLRSIAFSPNGMLAAAGGDKGKIVIWDMDL